MGETGRCRVAWLASLLLLLASSGCRKSEDEGESHRRLRSQGTTESKSAVQGGGLWSGLGQSDEDRALAFAEELATIIDDNQTDCEAMAAGLSKWNARNGTDYKELERRIAQKKDGGEDGAAQAKYRARLEVLSKKLMPGLMKCASNEKVTNALK